MNKIHYYVENARQSFPHSLKPNIYSSASQASSLVFVMQMSKFGIFDWLLVMGGGSGLGGEVIAVMCFEFLINLFTEFTVHACNVDWLHFVGLYSMYTPIRIIYVM